ncbi:MAG: hypothetical protein QM820_10290 [Minicystis sp.]
MPRPAQGARRFAAWGLLGTLVAGSACAQILGLEPWEPQGATGGAGGGSSSSASASSASSSESSSAVSSSSSTGGLGGSGGSGGGSTSTSSSSSSGCTSTNCSATYCDAATCMNDMCMHNFKMAMTPLGQQVVGDCKQKVCDGNGGTMDVPDLNDKPPTTTCKAQSCNPDGSVNTVLATPGTTLCKVTPQSASLDGTCDPKGACLFCDTSKDSCMDGCMDASESDVDCGPGTAACPKCMTGQHCTSASNCFSGSCLGGVCE